jgi:predicted DNA-binding transcriptional regulator YafY
MNQLDRLYQLERLLRSRQSLGRDALLKELEISRATLKRYLEVLRDRMNVPVVYDRYSNSYSITGIGQAASNSGNGGNPGQRQELPGVWFNQQEIVALLTLYKLIAGLDSAGMLQRHLQPILQRLTAMLGSTALSAQELQRRVRILSPGRREITSRFFELIGLALTQRRQLAVTYFTRSRNETSERVLSPQRLVHHRNTWYLDAWCHTQKKLQRFALDAVQKASVLNQPAKETALDTIEKAMDEGYGIYAGATLRWATLVFTPWAAIWVAPEQWHPAQKSRMLPDGSLKLEVPYTHDDELLMDIARHGADVRVIAPAALRDRLVAGLRKALDQYACETPDACD